MEILPFAAKVNKGYRYILTVIDVFSRYAWAVPLKTKSAPEVAGAFSKIFKSLTTHQLPRYIQTDQGKEFYNKICAKLFRAHNIHHYSVYSQFKAAIVERFNRTLRMRLSRYFTHTRRKVWHNVLDKMLKSYNNSSHRGIFGYAPADVSNNHKEVTIKLWELKNVKQGMKKKKKPKLRLLDYCRISRIKVDDPFVRNFDQNWSEEVFRVNAINDDDDDAPIRYTLEDLHGNVIQGKFYEPEVQKVAKPEEFRIERVLQTKGKGKYKQHFVKWIGYPTQYNSWIRAQDVIR